LKNRKTFISLVIAVIAAGFVSNARADTWALPKKEKYYSPDKKYYFEVTPKKLEGQLQYFSDKVDGKETQGLPKRRRKIMLRARFMHAAPVADTHAGGKLRSSTRSRRLTRSSPPGVIMSSPLTTGTASAMGIMSSSFTVRRARWLKSSGLKIY
jgi:hypothetical protein